MNLKTEKLNNVTIDTDEAERISKQLGLNKKLTELLMTRGYDTVDAINVFLHPSAENFYPPESMKGMKECCERLTQAMERGEKIVIYGDYDADGICAASILSLYLSSRGTDVYTHIPDRVGEGYGLNVETLERIIENVMPDLILTCDCGITAVNEVELAKDLGVDIIVTDHHEVGLELPDCIIVNPHQSDCKYPFKDLCGAGVALKIVQALGGLRVAEEYYDLAAIATVADLVSLTDENRLIVQLGLQNMPNSKNFGVAALVNSLNLKTVTSTDIAFKIQPRINAAGRMGSAYRAFELFTSADPKIVSERLNDIEKDNTERKTLCDDVYEQALAMLGKEDLVHDRAIVLTSEVWEKRITSILAARLVGDFKRPVFILVRNNGEYKGSCRSIEGINIYELLCKQADILKRFGGHNQAAGFSIDVENVELFKSRIFSELQKEDEDIFIPSIKYDLELKEEEITPEFASSLSLLEPTGGNGNPRPLFMTKVSSLTATPVKSNINHTILRAPGGSSFFARNAYRLNTYYNGAGERELVYEIAEGSYAPRLNLCGCSIQRLSVNDTLARAGYLRLVNYKSSSEAPVFKTYAENELDSLIDNKFGILLISGSKQSYERCADLNDPNIIMHEIFCETAINPYTRMIVAPELGKSFMLEYYNKVIFLDSPPSDAVISYINRRSNADVFIPEHDNRKELFSCVKADRAIFGEYYNAIKANKAIKAPNVFAYYKLLHSKVKTLELPQFMACLSVFSQLGLVTFKPDIGIIINNVSSALDSSEIFHTIEAWQNE